MLSGLELLINCYFCIWLVVNIIYINDAGSSKYQISCSLYMSSHGAKGNFNFTFYHKISVSATTSWCMAMLTSAAIQTADKRVARNMRDQKSSGL